MERKGTNERQTIWKIPNNIENYLGRPVDQWKNGDCPDLSTAEIGWLGLVLWHIKHC